MNETERERILRMVSDGDLRPHEAANLLAALAEPAPTPAPKRSESPDGKQPKTPVLEVQMQRPDGTQTTIQVPPHLVPMVWQIAKVAIRESARTAAQETWSGFKHMVRNKTHEVGSNVRSRFSGSARPQQPASSSLDDERVEARRRILQMVQNGRISAADAGRLIQQLDALQHQRAAQTALPAAAGK